MTDEEQRTLLLEAAKLSQGDFESRRDLEWKLSLGFWGSIGLFVYTVTGNKDIRPIIAKAISGHICCFVLLFALIAALHIAIIWTVQQAHVRDKALYWEYRKTLSIGAPREAIDRQRIWFWYHVFVTLIVLAGAIILLAIAP